MEHVKTYVNSEGGRLIRNVTPVDAARTRTTTVRDVVDVDTVLLLPVIIMDKSSNHPLFQL